MNQKTMKVIYACAVVILVAYAARYSKAAEPKTPAQARVAANRAACDAESHTVKVNHPGEVMEAIADTKDRCMEDRSIKQHLSMMELCRRAASRKAKPGYTSAAAYRECMTTNGYDAPD